MGRTRARGEYAGERLPGMSAAHKSLQAHFHSNVRVAAATAGALDDGGDNLLEVLCEHEAVYFLDERICWTDEQRRLEAVQEGGVLLERGVELSRRAFGRQSLSSSSEVQLTIRLVEPVLLDGRELCAPPRILLRVVGSGHAEEYAVSGAARPKRVEGGLELCKLLDECSEWMLQLWFCWWTVDWLDTDCAEWRLE